LVELGHAREVVVDVAENAGLLDVVRGPVVAFAGAVAALVEGVEGLLAVVRLLGVGGGWELALGVVSVVGVGGLLEGKVAVDVGVVEPEDGVEGGVLGSPMWPAKPIRLW